jgi:hypothetical protein
MQAALPRNPQSGPPFSYAVAAAAEMPGYLRELKCELCFDTKSSRVPHANVASFATLGWAQSTHYVQQMLLV